MLARLAVLLLLFALPLAAQDSPMTAGTAAPSEPAAAATPAAPGTAGLPTLPPEQARRLVDLLRDDARRAEFVANLEALLAASGTPAAQTEPDLPIPLAPDSLGAQLLLGIAQSASGLSDRMVAAAQAVSDFPLIWRWLTGLSSDPVAQARIADASWRLLLVFLLSLPTEWLIWRALRRPRNWLDCAAPPPHARWGQFRRLPLVVARLGLDLLPIMGFALVSYLLIGGTGALLSTDALPTSRLALLAATNAYIISRMIMAAVRMVLSPANPHLRLLRVSDETAVYLTVWARRIVVVAVCGWAIAEAGLLFGLAAAAHEALLKMVALVVHVFLIIIVLQNRQAVADWLRPRDEDARGAIATLRRRVGDVWHILAIGYLVALWGVWALAVPNGFAVLLRISVATIVIIIVARGLDAALRRGIGHGFRIGPDLARKYPGLEARANRYVPALKTVISIVITLVAVFVLFEAWGFDSLSWLATGRLGGRLIAALASIGFTLLLALLVWEGANTAIQRHLSRLARDAQAARSARVRTLVPILRTTLLITISVIATLVVLSELGVNIAPLLAGAGVVGIAVGFGSQTLVRDVITGMFLLLEDSMQVGDVVQLGGLSGSVEALSIRSIKLRAFDGSIHLIPFSAVTTVTNMTRDFSFAVADVTVGYGEDTDRVGEVLQGIVKEMRAEPRWESAIRDDLELIGVERLADSGVVIRTRIKTEPIQRWAVAREFNRRIKKRFDELGIEIPYPHTKIVVAGAVATPFASAAPSAPNAPTASGAPLPPPAAPPQPQIP